jgi:hypothetical protein
MDEVILHLAAAVGCETLPQINWRAIGGANFAPAALLCVN